METKLGARSSVSSMQFTLFLFSREKIFTITLLGEMTRSQTAYMTNLFPVYAETRHKARRNVVRGTSEEAREGEKNEERETCSGEEKFLKIALASQFPGNCLDLADIILMGCVLLMGEETYHARKAATIEAAAAASVCVCDTQHARTQAYKCIYGKSDFCMNDYITTPRVHHVALVTVNHIREYRARVRRVLRSRIVIFVLINDRSTRASFFTSLT